MENRKNLYIAAGLTGVFSACMLCIGLVNIPNGYFSSYWLGGQKTLPATPFPLDTLPELRKKSSVPILPEEVSAQMDQIQQQIIQIRGLTPSARINRIVISREEHSQNVAAEYQICSDDVSTNRDHYLDAIGITDPSTDVNQIYQEIYTDMLAGHFNQDTNELVVIDSQPFGISSQTVFAHEYVHALQYQNFDLDEVMSNPNQPCSSVPDRCTAFRALVEGDATYTEQLWKEAVYSRQDLLVDEIIDNLSMIFSGSSVDYFNDDTFFPYKYGLRFVTHLFEKGGWPAVDAAYGNPPLSTEQIIHPEKYPNEKPIPVLLPVDLRKAIPTGYYNDIEAEMGEWELFLVLADKTSNTSTPLTGQALQAVAGWGGDHYKVYTSLDSNATIFFQKIEWDTRKDAVEFFEFFKTYGAQRWNHPETSHQAGVAAWHTDNEYSAIVLSGTQTFWLTVPDSDIRADILAIFGVQL